MNERFESNAELIGRAKNGDAAALSEAVTANLGLVKSIALRFRDRGTEYEDLVQIGTVGMIKAIRSFDFTYGTAFSTYAVPLIVGEIKRYLRDDGLIRVSRDLRRKGVLILKEREVLSRSLGREPRMSELSEKLGMTAAELGEALDAVSPVRSLNEPQGEDGLTLEGTVAENVSEIDLLTDRIALREAVSSLPVLWRQILSLRYEKCLSQEETGRVLGLTQVKVSREEKKIMAYLRNELSPG